MSKIKLYKSKSSSSFKMKPKLWVISLSIVFLYFISGFFIEKFNFFEYDKTLEGTKVDILSNTLSSSENQIMWWKFSDDALKLSYNSQLNKKDNIFIFGKKADDSIERVKDVIGADFNGSFVALSNSVKLDMNGDGTDDKVYLSAKADTIDTRGFAPVNTYFEDKMLPFEVVIEGDYDLKIYYNNELLKGAIVKVTSEDGFNKELTTNVETGMIHIDNINTLRKGVNIMYRQDDIYYISSYIVEGHRLISAEHIQGLKNLGVLFIISAIGIMIIAIVRKFN